MSDHPTIIAVMRPDWVEPYAKLGHEIPVVVESNHPRFVVNTRLDYGLVQVALRDGYNVEIRQPGLATAGASVPPQVPEKEGDDTRVDILTASSPTGSTAASHEVIPATKKFMCPRCAADPRPESFGNDRSCAFTKDGAFTPDNWNCAMLQALMERECFDERRSDESIQIVWGEDYGGFIVLSRYKNRGCTSSAVLVGDFWPAQPLTYVIADSWLNGSFWDDCKSPALLDAVDPVGGNG